MKELLKIIVFNKYFIVAAAILIGLLSAYFWYQDNPIEETSEDIIKEKTGVDVDLTPETPEEKSKDKLSYLSKYMRWH
ncbi:hypothetical protein [Megaira polyxenophila phage MAnkyphage_25.80]|nr:hypothetical protein [Megaira polyxenophila phage MAnkyphage_25.80]